MYGKGPRLERELLRLFWGAGWAAVRAAGSGKANFPTPDLLVGNAGRLLAIECKSSKSDTIYLEKVQVDDLKKFASILGAEACIAARFNQQQWRFLGPEQLEDSPTKLKLTQKLAKESGKTFEGIAGSVSTL